MPTVAIVDGVKNVFYANEYPPPHFPRAICRVSDRHGYRDTDDHARLLADTQTAKRGELGRHKTDRTPQSVRAGHGEATCGAYRMKKLPRISNAEVVIHGVLKIVFLDGFEGVVDLRPLIAKGGVVAWLQHSENFSAFKIEEYRHAISWTDASGYEIDLSADGLRRDCERQADIHQLMVS